MPTPWKAYIDVPGRKAFDACHRCCRGAFEEQREILAHIVATMRPRTVACLGAGLLNDIPYRELVRSGATIHLVDWLPGIVEDGIRRAIIERTAEGAPDCVYCDLGERRAGAYCRHFGWLRPGADRVCDRFAAAADDPRTCAAFEQGEQPVCHRHDVTGGYATAFAEGLINEISRVRSWKQALTRATSLARRIRRHRDSLAIAGDSVDLVTAAMLPSQFDHEPYTYFARQAADLLGPPTEREERRLAPALKALHRTLVINQVEGLCEEIVRILAPGGRCLMSFEMFHSPADAGEWRLVDEMHETLIVLSRFFGFDFDALRHDHKVTRFDSDGGRSLVYSFVLAPLPRRPSPR